MKNLRFEIKKFNLLIISYNQILISSCNNFLVVSRIEYRFFDNIHQVKIFVKENFRHLTKFMSFLINPNNVHIKSTGNNIIDISLLLITCYVERVLSVRFWLIKRVLTFPNWLIMCWEKWKKDQQQQQQQLHIYLNHPSWIQFIITFSVMLHSSV